MTKHPEFLKGELQALNWTKDLLELGRKHSMDLIADETFNNPHAIAMAKQYAMLFQTMIDRVDTVQDALTIGDLS